MPNPHGLEIWDPKEMCSSNPGSPSFRIVSKYPETSEMLSENLDTVLRPNVLCFIDVIGMGSGGNGPCFVGSPLLRH